MINSRKITDFLNNEKKINEASIKKRLSEPKK